jgi:hypothetical protein
MSPALFSLATLSIKTNVCIDDLATAFHMFLDMALLSAAPNGSRDLAARTSEVNNSNVSVLTDIFYLKRISRETLGQVEDWRARLAALFSCSA